MANRSLAKVVFQNALASRDLGSPLGSGGERENLTGHEPIFSKVSAGETVSKELSHHL